MNNKDAPTPFGFTLAEIIVSLLLLSIIAVGSFKTFHFSQSSTNSKLIEFRRLQLQQLVIDLNQLKQTYPNIAVYPEFELLDCVIEHEGECL